MGSVSSFGEICGVNTEIIMVKIEDSLDVPCDCKEICLPELDCEKVISASFT